MPCNQQRILEREREREDERKRKKKKEEEKKELERKRKEQIEKMKKIVLGLNGKLGWKITQSSPGKFLATQGNDKMNIEISKQGILKTITDVISMPNHASAEGFLSMLARKLDGKWKIFHRHGTGAAHTHVHEHHHH
jgi:hypothetical protein